MQLVAGKIKKLAKQTASATNQINVHVDKISELVEGTASEVLEIEKKNNEVSDMVSQVSIAIAQQNEATGSIAHNIVEVSTDVKMVEEDAEIFYSSAESSALVTKQILTELEAESSGRLRR